MNKTWKNTQSLCLVALLFVMFGSLVGCSSLAPTPTPPSVALGPAPSITLAPPGPEVVLPGESRPIVAKADGTDIQVTWSASCLKGKSCQVLQKTTGLDNFFTAPAVADEQIIITVIASDKLARSASASLTFKVQAPPSTSTTVPTLPPAPTVTLTLPPTSTPPSISSPPRTPSITASPPVTVTLDYVGPSTIPFPNNMTVPCENKVGGKYTEPLAGTIWTFVYVNSVKRFYAQDKVNQMGGDWSGIVRFGNCNDLKSYNELNFGLIVGVADQAANAAIAKFLAGPGGFDGMLELPAGLQVANQLPVIGTDCTPLLRTPIKGTSLQGKVQIVNPKNCANLGFEITFSGTYSDVPDEVDIWVLVYNKYRLFFAQSDNSPKGAKIIKSNGKWSVITYLGAPEYAPETFEVVLVLANKSASDFFVNWLIEGARDGNFRGLSDEELPSGIMEVQALTVHRAK